MDREEIIKEAQDMFASMCVMESNYLDAWEWILKVATIDGYKMMNPKLWEKEQKS